MSATSLPGNTDTDFAGGTEGMAVQSDDVQSEALAALEENLKSTDEEDLYILMINQGNMLDIEAEYERQMQEVEGVEPYDKWQNVAGAVLATREMGGFRYLRGQIL